MMEHSDIHPEAERVQIALMRAAPPWRCWASSMPRSRRWRWRACGGGIPRRQNRPCADSWPSNCWGQSSPRWPMGRYLERTLKMSTNILTELLAVTLLVVQVLEDLDVAYW